MSSTRSRNSRLRLAALGLALTMAAGIAGAQVFGTPDSDFRGSVRATTPLVLPGSEAEIAGSGFKPGQSVTLLRGETVLNPQPYIADGEGGFKATLAIPADAAAGQHPVVVRVANPDAAAVFDLKVSKEVALSGQDRFDVSAKPLVRGLYQVAHGTASDALFVTAAVGRPPVTQSELLKLDPQTLEVTARITPAAVPGHDDGRVFAVYGVGVDDTHGNVWVTNTRDDTVAVYRQSDLSLVKQFDPGVIAHPRDVVVDAATGAEFVDIQSATEDDARRAMDIAADAQKEWAKSTPMQRSEILYKIFQLITDNTEDLALLQSKELGRALPDSTGEVAYGAAELAGMLGRRSDELPEHQRRAVVHADYLSNYASRL